MFFLDAYSAYAYYYILFDIGIRLKMFIKYIFWCQHLAAIRTRYFPIHIAPENARRENRIIAWRGDRNR